VLSILRLLGRDTHFSIVRCKLNANYVKSFGAPLRSLNQSFFLNFNTYLAKQGRKPVIISEFLVTTIAFRLWAKALAVF